MLEIQGYSDDIVAANMISKKRKQALEKLRALPAFPDSLLAASSFPPAAQRGAQTDSAMTKTRWEACRSTETCRECGHTADYKYTFQEIHSNPWIHEGIEAFYCAECAMAHGAIPFPGMISRAIEITRNDWIETAGETL